MGTLCGVIADPCGGAIRSPNRKSNVRFHLEVGESVVQVRNGGSMPVTPALESKFGPAWATEQNFVRRRRKVHVVANVATH